MNKSKDKAKNRVDKSKLFGRIMALILAGLMVLSICGTLILYLINM